MDGSSTCEEVILYVQLSLVGGSSIIVVRGVISYRTSQQVNAMLHYLHHNSHIYSQCTTHIEEGDGGCCDFLLQSEWAVILSTYKSISVFRK